MRIPAPQIVTALALFSPFSLALAGDPVTTASGLKYEVVAPGKADGPHPKMYSKVKVHYTGTFPDGKEFDSSRSGEPVEFRIGGVIEGWNEGLQLMTPGARYKFTIPPELAYGAQGQPPAIPPNSTLLFDVELLEVGGTAEVPEFTRVKADTAKKTGSGILCEEVKNAGADAAAQAKPDDILAFHFTYWAADGHMLQSTHMENTPFIAKPAMVRMKFLQEALPMMKVGQSMRFEAPADLTFDKNRMPPHVKEGEPTVWLLELDRIIDMTPPEFKLPKDEELQKTASGLKYKVIREGSGDSPRLQQRANVNYCGWLANGSKFDSSYDRKQPAEFGVGQVIPGWVEGLQMMKPGSIYLFVIPPELGYGDQGAGDKIPPKSTLVFYVELLSYR